MNRNKKSLTLNLKAEEGKEVLSSLVEKSDILIQNFRPGAIERLGFDWDTCHALNPRLIYASVSGYGQSGPSKERPAYDILLQGEGGLMSITGAEGGGGFKTGIAIADLTTAMFATQGILLAIIARERTGKGQYVDTAIQDGQAALMSHAAGNFFAHRPHRPDASGTATRASRPTAIFPARTGNSSSRRPTTPCGSASPAPSAGRSLADDSKWDTNAARVSGRDELEAEIEETMRARTRAEWAEIVSDAGVPCGAGADDRGVVRGPADPSPRDGRRDGSREKPAP